VTCIVFRASAALQIACIFRGDGGPARIGAGSHVLKAWLAAGSPMRGLNTL
jgi:hypothetical protein